MSRNAILPDGQRVNLDLYQYSRSTDTLTFLPVTGAGNTLTFVAATGMGAYVQDQLDAIQEGGAATTIQASSFRLDQVLDTYFDILTSTITLRGGGLKTGQKLYIEDVAGGTDANGYYMTLTATSPQLATAVYGGAGDAALSAAMLLFVKDGSAITNTVSASNPSGTIITVP